MKDYLEVSKELLEFIEKSPTAFHVVDNISKTLLQNGFTKLNETEKWNLIEGKKYFVTRNASSILAFTYPKKDFNAFNIIASHSDSPSFKVKENHLIKFENHYAKLNTEPYGGMIMSSWLDRSLSVAGRIQVKCDNKIFSKLVNIDRDLLVIPNLAIHMGRDVNSGHAFNAQVDMLPLLGDENSDVLSLIKKEMNIYGEVLSHDLFLYAREKGKIIGANNDYILCPRLDDLQCAFTSLKAILESDSKENIAVMAVFDNEEVGSGTKQGAGSTFLFDTLKRISSSSYQDDEDYNIAVAKSFMISADNAHAVHPNFAEKMDASNRNYINKGIVIKFNANQKYTTDSVSAAIFKYICEKACVPYQVFHNRSDMAGGSTLGNISNSKVSLNTVDIGLPQLAMHSAVETAGTKDSLYAYKAMKEFYNSKIVVNENEFIVEE